MADADKDYDNQGKKAPGNDAWHHDDPHTKKAKELEKEKEGHMGKRDEKAAENEERAQTRGHPHHTRGQHHEK